MFEHHKNTNGQGDAGLGVAIAWFTSKGHTVAIPLTDSQDYDLIVDNGVLNRIQVKTTTYKRSGHFIVDLRVKGGNKSGTGKIKRFDSTKVDVIFVITAEGTKYMIPSAPIQYISLSNKYGRYKV